MTSRFSWTGARSLIIALVVTCTLLVVAGAAAWTMRAVASAHQPAGTAAAGQPFSGPGDTNWG